MRLSKAKAIVCVLAIIVCHCALSQISNVFYLPIDHTSNARWESDYYVPVDGVLTTNFLNKISPEYGLILTNAIVSGECCHAEDDAKRCWGKVEYGFQLSISSPTNVFYVGGPSPIEIIFRNTTTNKGVACLDILAQPPVSIFDENGKQVAYVVDISKRWQSAAGATMGDMLPRRQYKSEWDLKDYLAHSKAGIYTIIANRRVAKLEPKQPEYDAWMAAQKTNSVNYIFPRPAPLSLFTETETNLRSGVLTIRLIESEKH